MFSSLDRLSSKFPQYVYTKFLTNHHYLRNKLHWNGLVKILPCSVVKGQSFIVKWLLILSLIAILNHYLLAIINHTAANSLCCEGLRLAASWDCKLFYVVNLIAANGLWFKWLLGMKNSFVICPPQWIIFSFLDTFFLFISWLTSGKWERGGVECIKLHQSTAQSGLGSLGFLSAQGSALCFWSFAL